MPSTSGEWAYGTAVENHGPITAPGPSATQGKMADPASVGGGYGNSRGLLGWGLRDTVMQHNPVLCYLQSEITDLPHSAFVIATAACLVDSTSPKGFGLRLWFATQRVNRSVAATTELGFNGYRAGP